MKIIEKTLPKDEFLRMAVEEQEKFAKHVDRVKAQYKEIKNLKENLPKNEILVQMDFAENYTCKTHAEIQGAYWNQTPVTIHPVVVYFRDESNLLKHKSIAVISDELSHSTSTVCSFLDALIPQFKALCPSVQTVHYWTDNPSSQYRNKTIFHFVAEHFAKYSLKARWNYFETGHGKGPCDGLGGTIKRMADEAVNRGAASIQDPKEFFDWAISSTITEVLFIYVEKSICRQKLLQLNLQKSKPVKGTMRLHAVGFDGSTSALKIRETSCYCAECLLGSFCSSWDSVALANLIEDSLLSQQNTLTMNHEEPVANLSESPVHVFQKENEVQRKFQLAVGDLVACIYDDQWYIGKVLKLDLNDVEITFTERGKGMFRWPAFPDIIWCNWDDILCKVNSFTASGKSKRLWKLNTEERDNIESFFIKRK